MDDDELNKLFGVEGDGDDDGDKSGDDDEAVSTEDILALGFEEDEQPPEEEPEGEPSEEEEPLDEAYADEDAEEEERPVKVRPDFDLARDFPLDPKSTLFLIAAIILVLSVVLIAFLPAFRIENIVVKGNYVMKTEDIIAESGLKTGSHLFFADYNGASKQISSTSPYIRGCRITFSIPSTVTITIDERSKIANVKTPDGYAALDDQGIVLELTSFDSKGKVSPVISGLNITHAAVGKKIVIGDESDYQKALIVLGSLLAADTNNPGGQYSIFENTREVRVLPSGYIFLTIRLPNGHTLQVKIDSLEQISTQTAWLLYVIDSKVFDNGFPSGALDMTGDEYIYRQFTISEDDELVTQQ